MGGLQGLGGGRKVQQKQEQARETESAKMLAVHCPSSVFEVDITDARHE